MRDIDNNEARRAKVLGQTEEHLEDYMNEDCKGLPTFRESQDRNSAGPSKPEMLWAVAGIAMRQRLLLKELDEVIQRLTEDLGLHSQRERLDDDVHGMDCTVREFTEATLHSLEQAKLRAQIANELIYVESMAEHGRNNCTEMSQNLSPRQDIMVANK